MYSWFYLDKYENKLRHESSLQLLKIQNVFLNLGNPIITFSIRQFQTPGYGSTFSRVYRHE